MKKYNVTMDIHRVETIYEIEASNEEEAFKKAKEESEYNDGGTDFTLFEVTSI